jgi:hypothetical protein
MGLVRALGAYAGGGGQGKNEMALYRLTFPSHVQNVPLCSMLFVGMTRSMPSTLSRGVMIPSTSHSVEMAAMSLV